MSNALWNLLLVAGAKTTSPEAENSVSATLESASAPTENMPLLTLICIGGVVLLVKIAQWIRRPKSILLTDTPARPNTLHPGHLVAVFLIWLLAGAGVIQILRYFGMGEDQSKVLGHTIGQGIGAAIALLAAHITFPGGIMRGMGLRFSKLPKDFGKAAVGYLCAIPLCMLLLWLVSWLLSVFLPDYIQKEHAAFTALRQMGTAWKIVIIFSATILAPLMEEVLFRGLLQTLLRQVIKPWSAILISSVLFAAIHSEPQNMPSLFLLSAIMGYYYERTGSLTVSILIHMLFNGVMITLQMI